MIFINVDKEASVRWGINICWDVWVFGPESDHREIWQSNNNRIVAIWKVRRRK